MSNAAARGRLIPLLLVVLLSAAGLVWLAAAGSTPPVVKIALVAPFEGEDRALGYDAIYAARLAVREINQRRGIGRYRLALVALDDRGEPEFAAEIARSLTFDPAVVGVIGHGLPETSAAAAAVYDAAGLPFLQLGAEPFHPFPAENLPAPFLAAYEEVTPFDETAGPLAGPTYDAVHLIEASLQNALANGQSLTPEFVAGSLPKVAVEGITGRVLP